MGLESKFTKMNVRWNNAVKFVAGITLQIYLVQFIVLRRFESLVFPINAIVVIALILALAILVYFIEFFIRKILSKLIRKRKMELPSEKNDN